jgi:hypothetical protein
MKMYGEAELSSQLHDLSALPPGKSPRCALERRLDGPQSRSGRYGEIKILDSTRTRTPTPYISRFERVLTTVYNTQNL